MNRIKRLKYISKKIKELRKSVDWSQSELARKSGVTSAAISQIEKGGRLPSLIVSKKLATALSISFNELIGDAPSSSVEINKEAKTFFRKFGDINKLSYDDQKIIQSIVKRFKVKK